MILNVTLVLSCVRTCLYSNNFVASNSWSPRKYHLKDSNLYSSIRGTALLGNITWKHNLDTSELTWKYHVSDTALPTAH